MRFRLESPPFSAVSEPKIFHPLFQWTHRSKLFDQRLAFFEQVVGPALIVERFEVVNVHRVIDRLGDVGRSDRPSGRVLAVAVAGKSVAAVAEVLVITGRTEDPFVWAAMNELSRFFPDADRDGEVWTWIVRNRSAITGASRNVDAARVRETEAREAKDKQGSLFESEYQ